MNKTDSSAATLAPSATEADASNPRLLSAIMAFPSPLLWFEVPDADAINAALLRDAEAMREASGGVNRSNQGGWHSESDLFRRQETSIRTLCDVIRRSVVIATQRVAPKFDLQRQSLALEGWININPTHAFNAPHRHPGFLWSGSYYVSVPKSKPGERSGMIEFFDPRTRDGTFSLGDSSVFASKQQYRPKAGTLVIFPSYLSHWVYPNSEPQERVSVAFNARFGGKRQRPEASQTVA